MLLFRDSRLFLKIRHFKSPALEHFVRNLKSLFRKVYFEDKKRVSREWDDWTMESSVSVSSQSLNHKCADRHATLTGTSLMNHLRCAAGFDSELKQLAVRVSPSKYSALDVVTFGLWDGSTDKEHLGLNQRLPKKYFALTDDLHLLFFSSRVKRRSFCRDLFWLKREREMRSEFWLRIGRHSLIYQPHICRLPGTWDRRTWGRLWFHQTLRPDMLKEGHDIKSYTASLRFCVLCVSFGVSSCFSL